jgi:predicted nucleic acid-binding protein
VKVKLERKIVKMQVTESTQNENNSRDRKDVKRLPLSAYIDAGILGTYDSSVKEREAHDKIMENYRRYLMKLCTLSNEAEVLPSMEVNEE